jgi:flavodoxin/Pyruvate/2-oxoacid:ferredoxin oxidoreductase delta subunit
LDRYLGAVKLAVVEGFVSTCLVVYFSQGGTTRQVAEAISRGWRARGHEVDLHDLKDGPPPDHGRYDVLGIGCPAHYYRPAITVSDYLATLPALSGKPVFTFVLHAAYLGDAGNLIRRALEEKGGKELGYARFRGAGRFLGYLKHGYQFSPADPGPDAIARAERFGDELAARVAETTHAVAAHDPSPPAVYRLERFLTGRVFIRHLYSRLFRVEEERCSHCTLCMSGCPTRNIREDSDGMRVWGRECILCFACEMNCPREAISSPVTWALFSPFMLYNAWAAARDPAIEHVRVVHAKGRTTGVP